MSYILLQAGGGAGASNLVFIGVMIAIFYLFFIRPQQKKQKNHKNFVAELSKGDQIVTMGGIHGKVVEVTDDTVTLDVDRGTKLTIEKSSVSFDASKKLTEEKKK